MQNSRGTEAQKTLLKSKSTKRSSIHTRIFDKMSNRNVFALVILNLVSVMLVKIPTII